MPKIEEDTSLISAQIAARLLMIEPSDFAVLERGKWIAPAANNPTRYRLVEIVHGYIKSLRHEQTRGRTAAECAAHLGIGRRRFIELIDQGVIARCKSSAYNLDEVREQYQEHLRKVAAARGEDSGAASLSASRARFASAKAEAAEFELARSRGEYVLMSEIRAQLGPKIAVTRERLLSIPGKIGSELATISVAHECETLVYDEIAEALNELAEAADLGS